MVSRRRLWELVDVQQPDEPRVSKIGSCNVFLTDKNMCKNVSCCGGGRVDKPMRRDGASFRCYRGSYTGE